MYCLFRSARRLQAVVVLGCCLSYQTAWSQQGNAPNFQGVGTAEMRPGIGQQAQVARPPVGQMAQTQEFDPDVTAVLQRWEQFGKITQSMEGKHNRSVTNFVFNVIKVSHGEFYYQTPAQGRMDIMPERVEKNAPPFVAPNGQKFVLQSEQPESWICDGENITHVNLAQKSYEQIQIPPQAQGQNIIDSPLPFLFGLTVEKAKQRYLLKTGSMHNPEKGMIHLIAHPLLQGDAAEWSEAEVLLDSREFLPLAIKLTAPGKNGETLYKFTDVKRNKAKGVFAAWNNPFKPDLAGYKKVEYSSIQDGTQQAVGPGPTPK